MPFSAKSTVSSCIVGIKDLIGSYNPSSVCNAGTSTKNSISAVAGAAPYILTPAFSAAIDEDGNQVCHSGGLNTFCYFNHDDEGQFYGGEYSTDPINILPGVEFDIDGNILFEEPEIDINANWAFVQHEILKINDNQYLFFIPEDQLHPVPSCATTPGCQWPEEEYDWEDDFFEKK